MLSSIRTLKKERKYIIFYKNITNRTCAQLERKREATFEVTGLLRVFIGAERREERKETEGKEDLTNGDERNR